MNNRMLRWVGAPARRTRRHGHRRVVLRHLANLKFTQNSRTKHRVIS